MLIDKGLSFVENHFQIVINFTFNVYHFVARNSKARRYGVHGLYFKVNCHTSRSIDSMHSYFPNVLYLATFFNGPFLPLIKFHSCKIISTWATRLPKVWCPPAPGLPPACSMSFWYLRSSSGTHTGVCQEDTCMSSQPNYMGHLACHSLETHWSLPVALTVSLNTSWYNYYAKVKRQMHLI